MSKDERLYVITGATGHVGGGIAERLLAAGKRVRVIGRTSQRLHSLTEKGAEPLAGSVDNAMDMNGAFQGAAAVFAMIPPDYAAADFRAVQKKIAATLAKAVADNHVGHVVVLSSIGGHLPSNTGPIVGLHELEEAMGKTKANVLSLRPTYFLENHLFGIPTIKATGMYITPLRADLKFPMIATKDIAAAAADRLIKLDFKGTSASELLGQRDLTMNEATAVLAKAIGKPDLKYVQAPYADAEKAMMGAGMSASIVGLYTEMYKGFNEGLIKAAEPRTAANTTPTSIEEFAKSYAQAFNAG